VTICAFAAYAAEENIRAAANRTDMKPKRVSIFLKKDPPRNPGKIKNLYYLFLRRCIKTYYRAEAKTGKEKRKKRLGLATTEVLTELALAPGVPV
jgi:hypothetical protein